MNSILVNWHGKNLHTAQEVNRGEGRSPYSAAPRPGRSQDRASASTPPKGELERMKKILEKVRNS